MDPDIKCFYKRLTVVWQHGKGKSSPREVRQMTRRVVWSNQTSLSFFFKIQTGYKSGGSRVTWFQSCYYPERGSFADLPDTSSEAILAAVILTVTCHLEEASLSLTQQQSLHISRFLSDLSCTSSKGSEQPKVLGGPTDQQGVQWTKIIVIRFRGWVEDDLF